MPKEKKGYQSLNIYHEIKRRIITLDLKPGEVLEEKQLAKELEVGRTPVREALLMLKNEGLVESHPNKTAYVKEITLKDVKDLFESLGAIEKLTACLAAQKISPQALKEIKKAEKEMNKAIRLRNYWQITSQNLRFHQLIAEASDNQYLSLFHEKLRNEADRLSYLAVSRELKNNHTLDEHHKKIKNHHKEIISCLEKKRIDQLEKLSLDHIKLFQNRIMTYLHYDIT